MRDGFHYKYWVYFLSSRSGTLYVGITGFFEQRIHQHKCDSIEGFTRKYRCHRLVYYETYQDVQVAIGREKQIKRWRRGKKIVLIEKINPRWQDLADNWGREIRCPGQPSVEFPETASRQKHSRDLSTAPPPPAARTAARDSSAAVEMTVCGRRSEGDECVGANG